MMMNMSNRISADVIRCLDSSVMNEVISPAPPSLPERKPRSDGIIGS